MRRVRIASAATLLLVAAFAAEAPSGASAAFDRNCGDQHKRGFMWFDVRADNIGCRKARRTANRYTFGRDKTPFGFRCGQRRVGDEVWAVRCGRTRGGVRQRVKFKFGA